MFQRHILPYGEKKSLFDISRLGDQNINFKEHFLNTRYAHYLERAQYILTLFIAGGIISIVSILYCCHQKSIWILNGRQLNRSPCIK